VSAPRHRQVAVGTALSVLLLGGCGGSDANKRAPQPPADRTQRSEAGARATLREYAAAFTSADSARVCDLLDPAMRALRSASKQRCRREAARLKDALPPAEAASLRRGFAALKPVLRGNVAALPGNENLSLRYFEGRWYVRLTPSAGASPTS